MANLCVCNIAFEWSGQQFRVGDVVEDDSSVYVMFPSRFDRQDTALSEVPVGYVTGEAGTVLAGGTLGTIIAGAVPVANAGGTVLGWVPLYNEITGE